MIFKSLTLSNYRVFNGKHEIDLAPRKEGLNTKPIILFGGLNGAGKTSILTGIRLALLGSKAIGRAVGNKDYHEFLKQQVNNKAFQENESSIAQISLEFTHTHQGIHSTYRVEREWSFSQTETVKLYQNEQLEGLLTNDQVQSFLAEIIPPRIGNLFFFDGEKIADLAEDSTGKYLKEAVQQLLGIDIVNRLSDDLDLYIKQITKDQAKSATKIEISTIEQEKKELLIRANQEREQEDKVKRQLTDIERAITSLEQEIQERGGAWAETKESEKQKAEELLKRQTSLQTKIINELDGDFPLSLAPKAIKELLDDLEAERSLKQELNFQDHLAKNLNGLSLSLAQEFTELKNTAKLSQSIASFFKNKQHESSSLKFDISDSDYFRLQNQFKSALDSKEEFSILTSELEQTESHFEQLSINIQRAPKEEELHKLYKQLRELDTDKSALKLKYGEHLKKAKSCTQKALELAKKLEKIYSSQKTDESISKAQARVEATQTVLSQFNKELTLLRVQQLEELFVASYRKLARKEDIKLSAQIDPITFDVKLVDDNGLAINRKSMSAGEKQIFAFAILEALGKLSGKVLPVVVDTPLGRLDSKHRDKLIKHYFPEAGEQVILLSTDTEVDKNFFAAISNEVSHVYEINFDQESRCSKLTEGYFWTKQQQEIA